MTSQTEAVGIKDHRIGATHATSSDSLPEYSRVRDSVLGVLDKTQTTPTTIPMHADYNHGGFDPMLSAEGLSVARTNPQHDDYIDMTTGCQGWAFQGVDTAFFESLMRSAGNEELLWPALTDINI